MKSPLIIAFQWSQEMMSDKPPKPSLRSLNPIKRDKK